MDPLPAGCAGSLPTSDRVKRRPTVGHHVGSRFGFQRCAGIVDGCVVGTSSGP